MSRTSISMRGVAVAALLWGALSQAAGAQADAETGEDSSLRMLTFGEEAVTDVQASPACPDGVCPGLGNIFYLPAVDAQSINTGGRIFLKNRKLGECARLSEATQNTASFREADSMESFVRSVMAEADLQGDYKTAALSARGTASVVTDQSAERTEAFHSSGLNITVGTHAVDVLQTKDCFGPGAIAPDFLEGFEALALIDARSVSAAASWTPYVTFLHDQGSHVVMQQLIGSRFQQWESSVAATTDIQNALKAKACAETEGVSGPSGWSVTACGGYTEEEKQKSLRTSANSHRVVLGGTTETRNALTNEVTKKTLRAFVDSAQEGDQPIRFVYKPIWDVLASIYTRPCASDGNDSEACRNLQRAYTLQAAYEGWTAIGCNPLKTTTGATYQSMQIAGATTQGINTYKCVAEKTGCRSTENDCHGGGAIGAVCYCHGPSCLDTGPAVSGTNLKRTKVRGSQGGSTYKGVNNSCFLKLATCRCDKNWSGGLLDRTLYLQSTAD